MFDENRFDTLITALTSVDELVGVVIERAHGLALGEAKDIAEMSDDESMRDDIVEMESERLLEEARPGIYIAAIRLQIMIASAVERWLETHLPPVVRRIQSVELKSWQVSDIWLDSREAGPQQWLTSAQSALRFLMQGSATSKLLIRALFLREAFSQLLPESARRPGDVESLKRFLEAGLSLTDSQSAAIKSMGFDWPRIWEHYSLMAELEAARIVAPHPTAELKTVRGDQQMAAILQRLGEHSDKLDSVLSGQTAMMDRLEAIEAAAGALIKRFDRASDEEKQRCEQTIRAAIGTLFDALLPTSRKFLLAAEWAYSNNPVDLDFSSVVVVFTKAFEAEFRQVTAPLHGKLQELAERQDPKFRLQSASLGPWLGILKNNRSDLGPAFRQSGLDVTSIIRTIESVNEAKGAKHLDEKTYADATSFRNLFLGKKSVFLALHPGSAAANSA